MDQWLSLPTSDHYRRIIKDFFTDWYVKSNMGKLPVNGGLNGHTLCLHRPLCLHCAHPPIPIHLRFHNAGAATQDLAWPVFLHLQFSVHAQMHVTLGTCRRVHDIMPLSKQVTVIYPVIFAKPHQPVSFELDLNIDFTYSVNFNFSLHCVHFVYITQLFYVHFGRASFASKTYQKPSLRAKIQIFFRRSMPPDHPWNHMLHVWYSKSTGLTTQK